MKVHFSLLFILNTLITFGQEKGPSYINTQFDQAQKTYNEWVYCHLNKNDFTTDEDLFFQGYILKERDNVPSPFATNLIVDIINNQQKVVKQKFFYIENGIAPGQIDLSGLPPGSYKLQAYSNWMRNFSNKNAFSSAFNILGEQKDKDTHKNNNQLSSRIYPEGNSSIAGIEQKWYVALDNWDGQDLKLQIIDDLGHNKIELDLTKKLSSFFFAPESGHEYLCHFISKEGETLHSTRLDLNFSKATIAANIFEENQVSLQITTEASNDSISSYYLAVHKTGKLHYFQQFNTNKSVTNFKINTKEFESGIYHASLFKADGNLLSERPFYVNSKSMSALKWDFIQEKERLFVVPKKNLMANQTWNYSISFFPNESIYRQYDMDAFAYFYKDINLGWTNKLDFSTNQFADQLEVMDQLLQLYYNRQFSWNTIVSQNESSYVHEYERGFSLKGKVHNYKMDDLGKGIALLNSVDNSFSLTDSIDNDGKFEFNKLYLIDSSRISLITEISRAKNWKRKWTLDSVTYSYPIDLTTPVYIPSISLNSFKSDSRTIRHYHLEEVQAKMKLKTNRNMYAGINDDVFLVNEQSYKKYNSILDILRSRFMIQINELSMGALEIKFRGGMLTMDPSGNLQSNNPVLVIDGMLSNDLNILRDMQVTDLEEIAINKDGINLLGPAGANGAIFLKTRTRPLNFDMNQIKSNQEKFDFFVARGYTLPKPFKKPNLFETGLKNVNCLNWQTGKLSSKQGKIEIDTKNFPPNFIGVIQAIDNNGNLLSQKYISN